MFKVNDYVVYGSTGVCQIQNIRKGEYNDNYETDYYVLHPVYSDNMTIMIPVNNPNIVMRAISTKDDALSLIAMIPGMDTVWIDDDKQRVNIYKAALRTGKTEEWVKIIKTLYLEKEAKFSVGKKLKKTDEEILNTAEKNLNEELAIALNISLDEVVAYISEHIPQNKVSIN